MNQPKFIYSVAKILFVSLCFLSVSFAQTETAPMPKSEPSYDVILQILVASNSAGEKSNLPASLSNVVKKLNVNYPQTNFNLTSTFMQRVANSGNMQFKGIAASPNGNSNAPIFSEWSLTQLKNIPTSQVANSLEMRQFHFGQRIPIATTYLKDENGKSNPVINYESIGLTMQNLNFTQNVPTIVGSLSTPNPNEIMFLILTVKLAEN